MLCHDKATGNRYMKILLHRGFLLRHESQIKKEVRHAVQKHGIQKTIISLLQRPRFLPAQECRDKKKAVAKSNSPQSI